MLAATPALLAASAWPLAPARPAAPTPGRAGSPRAVCLDYGLAETLLALGAAPVGLPGPAEYRVWVVEPGLPEGVADVGQRAQPNLERLAALVPDAVFAAADHDPILPLLRRVAPVLRLPVYTPERRPWERSVEAARAIGAWLGRPDDAERLIAAVEGRHAAARAALAGRAMRPVLLASFLDPRHLRLYGRGCILQAGLDRLGLRNAWSGQTGPWGSATVGLEALAPLEDASLFVFDPRPPDLAAVLDASPLWRALPFVRAGRVFALPPVLMFGTLPAADRFAAVLAPRLAEALALG